MQPLEETIWRFLRKLKIERPYHPAIPLLGVYPKETKSLFFKLYFIDYAITVFPIFPPLYSLHPVPPHPPASPLSSCPWVVHVSSLTPLFPKPFLSLPVYLMPTSHASFSLYLSRLIPPLPLPTENPPCDVHFSDSVAVIVVCLVFVFIVFLSFIFLGSFVDSCEFVVIFTVHSFDLPFLR